LLSPCFGFLRTYMVQMQWLIYNMLRGQKWTDQWLWTAPQGISKCSAYLFLWWQISLTTPILKLWIIHNIDKKCSICSCHYILCVRGFEFCFWILLAILGEMGFCRHKSLGNSRLSNSNHSCHSNFQIHQAKVLFPL